MAYQQEYSTIPKELVHFSVHKRENAHRVEESEFYTDEDRTTLRTFLTALSPVMPLNYIIYDISNKKDG